MPRPWPMLRPCGCCGVRGCGGCCARSGWSPSPWRVSPGSAPSCAGDLAEHQGRA